MRTFVQSVLAISMAAALLVGCGGSQFPSTMQQVLAPHGTSSGGYQVLYRFHPPRDGSHPAAGLLDVNGALYGTTMSDGLSHTGMIYRISTAGAQKVLYRF
ncbi:MAG: choice-of-anchor tandem repeat GloVer-containing protein, partial [Candidatus Cybelea sp.]